MMQRRSVCQRGDKCNPLTHKARLNCAFYHHPTLTPEEIADKSEIALSRLKNYASESHANDLIPFKALLRFCSVTGRWDLIDAELNTYRRGVVDFDAKPTADALNESIDVSTASSRLLELVRELGRDGLDAADRSRVREQLRAIRAEVEQVDASMDSATTARGN
jgi:hypothetical protein